MKTTVNEDGSVTTSIEDESPAAAEAPAVESSPEKEPEAKVVKAPAKKTASSRSTAEGK